MISRVYSKRLRKHVWQIDLTIAGTRIREASFATKIEAECAIGAIRNHYRNDRLGIETPQPETTLADLLEARLKCPIAQSTRNRRRLVGYFEEFVLLMGDDLPVRHVSLARLKAFRDTLIARHKPSTVEFKMAGVIGSLNNAKLYFNHLEDYRAPSLASLVVESRERTVPRSELRDVIKFLREPYRQDPTPRLAAADSLEMLILTGARVGEILSLQKRQVDFDRNQVTIHASKTHSKRAIPLTKGVEAILRRRLDSWPSYPALRHLWRLSAQANKILVGYDGWTIHDIRHTAASNLAEAGVSHSVIAALLGHKLGGITAKYTHASIPALTEAVRILESWWIGDVTAFQERKRER
jgi:integrase